MNILVVFPFLLHNEVKHGGGKQILRLVKGLSVLGHNIHIMCLSETDPNYYQKEIKQLSQFCASIKIFIHPKLNFFKKVVNFLRPSIPPQSRNCIIKEARNYVKFISSSGQIDLVHIVFTYMGEYAKCVDKNKCDFLIDTQEIGTRKYLMLTKKNKSLLSRFHSFLTYLRTKRYEKHLLENALATIAISKEESSFIQQFCKPKRTLVIPSLIDKKELCKSVIKEKENTLLFFGSFNHTPNIDAMIWFCNDIFPLILKRVPEVFLNIVGENAQKKLTWLQKENINIVGTVPNMKPWISEATVIVSPIISGGGARIKNIETLAMGKPLVTTSLGAEGIGDGICEGYYIENDAAAFAKKVVELLINKELRAEIGALGKKKIEVLHDNVYNAQKIVDVCNQFIKDQSSL